MLLDIPCLPGDEVWCVPRNSCGYYPRKGVVSKMAIEKVEKNDTHPRLRIVVRGVCHGEWGKNIFATREDCEAECRKKNMERTDKII